MATQTALALVLQNFTRDLLKVFSDAVALAIAQLTEGVLPGLPALPAGEAPAAPRKRGRPRKDTATVAVVAKSRKTKARKTPKVVEKSSPAEVNRLGERIMAFLTKASKNLAVKEIRAGLKLSEADEGRFGYALSKLKASSEVVQHGERGQARYGIGTGKPKAKRGPGRPRKVPVEAAPPPAAAEPASVTETEV